MDIQILETELNRLVADKEKLESNITRLEIELKNRIEKIHKKTFSYLCYHTPLNVSKMRKTGFSLAFSTGLHKMASRGQTV